MKTSFLKNKKQKTPKTSVDFLRGRLPWRIIYVVFITILVVEASILAFRVESYENQKLDDLIQIGKSTVVPILVDHDKQNQSMMLLDNNAAQHIIATTLVRGLAIYPENQSVPTDVYGETTLLSPMFLRGQENQDVGQYITWRSDDKNRYEVILKPSDLEANHTVIIRLDSSHINSLLAQFIGEAAVVALLLSAFVTTVLILVLGKWLLEPILLLRGNLLRATKDAKNAGKYMTPYVRKDELGSVIVSANRLIKQNAENLAQLSQQAEDRIYRLAYFDTLTGLPNRTHFIQKAEETIKGLSKSDTLCFMVMDLDNFGDINDTLGYQAGDTALETIGQNLSKALDNSILTARLGDDEFAAIIQCSETEFKEYAERVFDVFAEPLKIMGNEYFVESSIGAAFYPKDTDTAVDLLKKAETALDQAKQEERGTFRLYAPEFDQAVQSRIQMVQDLRVAVDEKQFSLMYQPQFDAKTQQIIGAEALIRWFKPGPEGESKQIFPDQFIPVAEQSGLIVPIGKWVMYEAARFAKKCHEEGLPKFRVAVNISGVQFYRDDIVALTKQVLEDVDIDPKYVELEVTESAVIEDLDETIKILQNLKELGVDLAIDDFGTGYSSLSYLKKFPIHRLKVDRSFVMDVTEDPDDAAITRTIIQLGHSMGLKVIAEGVETQDHVNFLLKENCDEFQGYFYSKPLAADEFVGFVKGLGMNKKEHA